MTAGDVYMGLDRGVIDGAITGYPAAFSRKWYEVAKYVLWTPVNSSCKAILMNKKVWNSMPPDVQANIEQAIQEYKFEHLKFYAPKDIQAVADFKAKGADVYSLSASEVAKWQTLSASIVDKWIAAQEAKGNPAKNMIALIREIVARYQ